MYSAIECVNAVQGHPKSLISVPILLNLCLSQVVVKPGRRWHPNRQASRHTTDIKATVSPTLSDVGNGADRYGDVIKS